MIINPQHCRAPCLCLATLVHCLVPIVEDWRTYRLNSLPWVMLAGLVEKEVDVMGWEHTVAPVTPYFCYAEDQIQERRGLLSRVWVASMVLSCVLFRVILTLRGSWVGGSRPSSHSRRLFASPVKAHILPSYCRFNVFPLCHTDMGELLSWDPRVKSKKSIWKYYDKRKGKDSGQGGHCRGAEGWGLGKRQPNKVLCGL